MTRCSVYAAFGTLLLLFAACTAGQPGGSSSSLPSDAREVKVQEKLEQRSPSIVQDLLIGEPGVLVQGRDVRIRGSSEGPLWVIDGVYTDSPLGINPQDVARMWIVRSGSGYGRRGANGVIIIETRRGG